MMSNYIKETLSDEVLCKVSKNLRYHIKMYIETLFWLKDNSEKPEYWDTIRNAVIEDHLIHSRILINFIRFSKKKHPTDVLAIDYFQNTSLLFRPEDDTFLKNQAKEIGGQLVHLTTNGLPGFKGEQEWHIKEISNKLVPELLHFLEVVPENRLEFSVKNDCLNYLDMLSTKVIPLSINQST